MSFGERRFIFLLFTASVLAGAGCATTPHEISTEEQAQACQSALREVAGRLEAEKQRKHRYPKSLARLPKTAPLPGNVNGFPLEYRRTRKGFQLVCQYEKS